MTLSSIKFPVLRSVQVEGYALFPGAQRERRGLSYDFENGVTVMVGINGLGKTTLLNVLLRLIIGPSDVPREDPEDVGSTRHEIIPWQNPGYFSRRVPDRATSATVSGHISFGDRTIYVVRKLSDLSLMELRKESSQVEPSETEYRKLVVEMSGVSNFYDFHFVVRNLLFYLEDRRPLLWSEDGQFEIARILFVSGTESQELSAVYDRVRTVDSRYRNLLTETNRLVTRLNQQQRAERLRGSNLAKIAELKTKYLGAQSELETVDGELENLIDTAQSLRDESQRIQLEVEESLRYYEGLQQGYFAKAFPNATETFQYTLAHIVSGDGCLVCGSTAAQRAEQLRTEASLGICPVCGSPPGAQERAAAPVASAEQVNTALSDLQKKQIALDALKKELEPANKKIEMCLENRRGITKRLEEQRAQLIALGAQLPSSGTPIDELEASVRVNQQNLSLLRNDRDQGIMQYRGLVDGASARIQSVIVAVQEHFQTNVKHFLAEKCDLNYRTRTRPLGQSGERVAFPGFDVLMTSSVFPDQPRPRGTIDEISESQKEFIDLAFRMALIETAAPAEGGAMLVLETPEASLDSLFVYRAGDLLRRFASSGGAIGNVLIASSNLSDANMIPALLGIDRTPELATEVPRHVLNLLEIAAPNRAFIQEREAYLLQYRHATTPDPDRIPSAASQ